MSLRSMLHLMSPVIKKAALFGQLQTVDNVDILPQTLAFPGQSISLLGIRLQGLPIDSLFSQESRTFRSKQLCIHSLITLLY